MGIHIPSQRVASEMRSEDASSWFVPAIGDPELAFLLKAPTTTLKALLSGASMELLLARADARLCVGVRVSDQRDSPVAFFGVARHAEEHVALERALMERRVPAFLFNEMDVCIASSEMVIDAGDARKALEHVGDVRELYVGPFDEAGAEALDRFTISIDAAADIRGVTPLTIVDTPVSFTIWTPNGVSFVGLRGSESFRLSDLDEGEVLEQVVWASLESVFPFTLFKNPQVRIGQKRREFTDVLAYHQYGSFLFETKDLSVLSTRRDRDPERRLKGVQKQAKKAIAQLTGAAKALLRGDDIEDAEGQLLSPVREQPPHCVVLITELEHRGDWSDVENRLRQASRETRAFFQLLDLRELIRLLKASSGKPELLDYNLMERWKLLFAEGVHIRSQVAPREADSD